MNRPKTVLCAAVAAACLAAVAAVAGRAPAPPAATAPAAVTAYTLAQRQTYTPAGGRPFLRAEKKRYQRADGLFVVTHIYYRRDGSVEAEETGLGVPGVGLFRADERGGSLEFVAALDEEEGAVTEDELKTDANFLREDALSGQRVMVLRRAEGEPGAARYREVWRAPALRNFELKTVAASPLGTEVTEPVELRLGEPDDAAFRRLARLPRSHARFEERIREAERRGEAELAGRLRRHLERARR